MLSHSSLRSREMQNNPATRLHRAGAAKASYAKRIDNGSIGDRARRANRKVGLLSMSRRLRRKGDVKLVVAKVT